MDLKILLNKLLDRQNLTESESLFLADEMMQGNLSPVMTAAFLIALRSKGETADEIYGFIQGMRKEMVRLPYSGNALDTCGTGGDGKGTFNISTAVAFVVAGAGMPVAKNGNRAASSKCGSADVLEALGMHITLLPEQAGAILEKTGFIFTFAPLYHPAMKFVAPVRKELQVRTIFNFLGPFLNPADVKRQIIGVPNKSIAETLATVGAKLGYEHLLIVTSEDGLDEISIAAKTFAYEIIGNEVTTQVIDPSAYGMKGSMDLLIGGSAEENATMIRELLHGEKGPRRDIVLLNSAFALVVAGKATQVEEGIKLATTAIDSGSARKVLENTIEETKHYA